jgi:hypothetical protein
MLREIQNELKLTRADLERVLGMDPRTIDKLLADTDEDPWRLDRGMLHRLLLFAHERGFDAFQIEPHPIWRSFENRDDILIFRGSNRTDAAIEDHLVKYFSKIKSDKTQSTTEPAGVAEAMRTRNCVIIGSPKANPASEIALTLLWGARPFDAEVENCDRIPIHFLGMTPDHDQKTSALLQESSRHGFNIQLRNAKGQNYLRVDWLPREKYGPFAGSGQEAAVLVACRRPLGTSENVTTVIIAGYTALSTLVAAQEATYKKIPDLRIEDHPGQAEFAILRFRYNKRPERRNSIGLRTPEEGSTLWGPPWEGFFEA